MYLAEKFGAFLPTEPAARAECLSWLFWQMGSAPYLGGGFGHFYAYAPTKMEYPIDRFAMEVKRQLDVLDRRLAESEYLAGAGLHHRRHGDLALVWRAGEGLAVRRRRIPGGARIQARPALGGPIAARPAVEARAHGQPHVRASLRASCTSGTTPATSTRRRRTSSPPPASRLDTGWAGAGFPAHSEGGARSAARFRRAAGRYRRAGWP